MIAGIFSAWLVTLPLSALLAALFLRGVLILE
jgi:phosphate/sulfate permease